MIDSTGLPKAAYYYLKRVLQPLAVFVSDEDCNGLMIHIVYEGAAALDVSLDLQLFRFSLPVGPPMSKPLALAPASAVRAYRPW